jgi:hypothetical protein
MQDLRIAASKRFSEDGHLDFSTDDSQIKLSKLLRSQQLATSFFTEQ